MRRGEGGLQAALRLTPTRGANRRVSQPGSGIEIWLRGRTAHFNSAADRDLVKPVAGRGATHTDRSAQATSKARNG